MKICFFGTYDKNYTANKIVYQGLLENHVDVLEVNSEVKLTALIKKEDLSVLSLLRRVFKKYRIFSQIIKNWNKLKSADAIYVAYPGHFDVLLAYPIAKILRKKLVFNPVISFYSGFADEQGILDKKSYFGKLVKFSESIVYKVVDLLLPDTPYQKEYFKKTFNIPSKKLKVFPIGADDKLYKYTPYKNISKKINVVYYGLYSPVHGVEHIVECANILRHDKDIKFTMVGQGNTFEENFKRAKDLKLTNIDFFHHIPEEKHITIIQKADIFLGFLQKHPSVERIIPNKVYQGLSLGKVVITADSPVIRSVFTHKNNMYFCKPASARDLSKVILDLKNNPKLRVAIAKNGHQLFTEKFTPRAIGKTLIGYIGGIL